MCWEPLSQYVRSRTGDVLRVNAVDRGAIVNATDAAPEPLEVPVAIELPELADTENRPSKLADVRVPAATGVAETTTVRTTAER